MVIEQKLTNPHRSKQLEIFYDKDHPEMSQYYDLLDKKLSKAAFLREMRNLIQKNPDFYDPFLVVANILKDDGKEKEAMNILYTAYERAIKRIVDKEGNFPKELHWGWLENRHLIRTIQAWAFELWEQDKPEEALEIFRKLLHSNPGDNIGARHSILAILMKLKANYEDKFASENAPGYLDGFKLCKWFDDNSKKFPEEFGWWEEAVKRLH